MVKKIIYVILIIFCMCIIFTNFSYATSINVDETFNRDGSSSTIGIYKGIRDSEDIATNIIANFILLFRVIGVGTAIIILMALGIKFIFGSVEQRTEVKKHLVNYIIGATVLFGGAFLLGYLQEFMKNFN